MSGGHFNYCCHHISSMVEELKHEIEMNDSPDVDRYGDYIGMQFSKPTMDAITEINARLEDAATLAREIEWLYSGDHSEESFIRLVSPILNNQKK